MMLLQGGQDENITYFLTYDNESIWPKKWKDKMAQLDKVTGKKEYVTTLNETDITVGDTVAFNFLPNIEWSKWGGEVNFKLAFPLMNATTEVETFANGAVEMTVGDLTYKSYVLPGSDEVLELEVIGSRKQAFSDPYIQFAIQHTDGVHWAYQPELTQDEINNGSTRPENVVGSYALYWNKKNNQYKTGKICHMFAWEWEDSLGSTTPGKLEYTPVSSTAGLLRVTCNDNWLRFASYPVKAMGKGDTLGYSSVGASREAMQDDYVLIWDMGVAPSGGALATIHGYHDSTNSVARTGKLVLYDEDFALCDYTAEISIPDADSSFFATGNAGTQGYTIVQGTKYYVGIWLDAVNSQWAYDADAGEDDIIYDSETYSDTTPPATHSNQGDIGTEGFHSIYITYTAGGSIIPMVHYHNASQ